MITQAETKQAMDKYPQIKAWHKNKIQDLDENTINWNHSKIKKCSKCNIWKPKDKNHFWTSNNASDKLTPYCSKCTYKISTNWQHNNPEKYREVSLKSNLKIRYNMTLERYYELLEGQNRGCAICGKKETSIVWGKTRVLAVDHDHSCCPGEKTCGKCVRELLCQNCNSAVGLIFENIDNAYSLIKYLKKWSNK